MKNKLLSFALKLIGFSIMALAIIHVFGIYEFPSAGLGKPLELLIAFLVGLALFLVPANVLEKKIEKKLDDLADKN